jgi:uncharacterized coiled-coil protein SlyX
VRIGFLLLSGVLLTGACASKPEPAQSPAPRTRAPAAPPRSDLEKRVARLELSLMDREAQVEELQKRLEETRQEVVRAMAKLQTLASRAEAASGIAEAEVALQPLKAVPGQTAAPEATQASRLLRESSSEFDKENYGGAVYLANRWGRSRTSGRRRTWTRTPRRNSFRAANSPQGFEPRECTGCARNFCADRVCSRCRRRSDRLFVRGRVDPHRR